MDELEKLGFVKRHVVNGRYPWVVEVNFVLENTYGQQIIRWAFERKMDAAEAVWDGKSGAVAKAIDIINAHRTAVSAIYLTKDAQGRNCIELGIVIRPMGLEEAKNFKKIEATYGVGTSATDACSAMSAAILRRGAINRNIVFKPTEPVVLHEERIQLLMEDVISVSPTFLEKH